MLKIAQLLLQKEKIDAEDMVQVLGPRPEVAFPEDDLHKFLESKKRFHESVKNEVTEEEEKK